MSEVGTCFLCSHPSSSVCPVCGGVYFCGSAHGRLHTDGVSCYPYTLGSRDGVGRMLVAARDLLPGQLVYSEEPLVVGPNQESGPICLGCMAALDLSYVCEGCGYPMCDWECSQADIHRYTS